MKTARDSMQPMGYEPASGPASAFGLSDLAIFDEAHLREVICDLSGGVPPQLAGHAFAPSAENDDEQERLAALAEKIERALPPAERTAFARSRQDPQAACEREMAGRQVVASLYWDLVYWKSPVEYDLLTAGEQVHLGALDIAGVDGAVVLDAGAGAGRVTLPIARRARHVYALDAAPPLLSLLDAKLAAARLGNVEMLCGVFRRLPLPDDSVDVVVCCSSFGTEEVRGGARGLDELLRVTRPGGRIVVLWPGNRRWFERRGFRYVSLPGELIVTFPTLADAYHVAERFYSPTVTRYLDTHLRPMVPYEVIGVSAPRDLCWLTVCK